MIRKDLINLGDSTDNPTNTSSLTDDEKTILSLINEERKKAGLIELSIDDKLQKIAHLKAEDMVNNNYFAHNSPTYGSPFDMMKNNGITYRAAGENIAGNPSLKNAVASWMNSASHKENVLSNNYNYVGIGVVPSQKYGYIIVAMFIGK